MDKQPPREPIDLTKRLLLAFDEEVYRRHRTNLRVRFVFTPDGEEAANILDYLE